MNKTKLVLLCALLFSTVFFNSCALIYEAAKGDIESAFGKGDTNGDDYSGGDDSDGSGSGDSGSNGGSGSDDDSGGSSGGVWVPDGTEAYIIVKNSSSSATGSITSVGLGTSKYSSSIVWEKDFSSVSKGAESEITPVPWGAYYLHYDLKINSKTTEWVSTNSYAFVTGKTYLLEINLSSTSPSHTWTELPYLIVENSSSSTTSYISAVYLSSTRESTGVVWEKDFSSSISKGNKSNKLTITTTGNYYLGMKVRISGGTDSVLWSNNKEAFASGKTYNLKFTIEASSITYELTTK